MIRHVIDLLISSRVKTVLFFLYLIIIPLPSNSTTIFQDGIYQERPESEIYIPKTGKRFYSYPSSYSYDPPLIQEEYPEGILMVKSNLPQASWSILQGTRPIVSGEGTNSLVSLPPNVDYFINGKKIEGYSLRIYPRNTFKLRDNQTTTIELNYKKAYGTLRIVSPILSGEVLKILIEGNKLDSPLEVEAVATSDGINWESPFLPDGDYKILLVPSKYYNSINPILVKIRNGKDVIIKPSFKGAQSIKVVSNIPQAFFILESQNGKKKWRGEGSSFKFEGLLPGIYSLSFFSNNPAKLPPSEKKIILSRHRNEDSTIFAEYRSIENKEVEIIKEKPPVDKSKIYVHLDIPSLSTDPRDYLLPVPKGMAIIGDFFADNHANEKSPSTIFIDEFQISKYEITNSQFADWLTKAFKKGIINYSESGSNKGIVFDQSGNLLFKTHAANALSQIFSVSTSNEIAEFKSLPGKENYPVIFVSWFGAQLYSKEFGCRLPEENEWEKAAGMKLNSENEMLPLEKYKYGFSKNIINRAWANYKSSNIPIKQIKVNTTPIGFYNGKNLLDLDPSSPVQQKTENAKSPIGAYDMSGNVWEITGNEESKIIAKGGCYDSLSEGVRVAERLPLTADYCDEFTGFRISK